MVYLERFRGNPIIRPNKDNFWEADSTFNGCVVKDNGKFHIVYRAVSASQFHHGFKMKLSTIGHAISDDGLTFTDKRLFIRPAFDWEAYGCEDARITKFNNKFFIFYTALSTWPPSPPGIKVGVAITKDFFNLEKHSVTPFNSKAMTLFPEEINGKIAAILTANTDIPPSKICIAFFDKEDEIWSRKYWDSWYSSLDKHVLQLPKGDKDQVEVGAPPIKTKDGWLFVYSHIKNYLSPPPTFGIEAVLLDLKNPFKIIGKTKNPLLVPKEEYELYGNVPNIVFPSGAIVKDRMFFVYYGGADTTCCVATCNFEELIKDMLS